MQLQWNASSIRLHSYLSFRVNTTNDDTFYSEEYTTLLYLHFSIADFYGMSNPYLESRISPDGVNNYVVERVDLSEGGTVTLYDTSTKCIVYLLFVTKDIHSEFHGAGSGYT